MATEQSLNYGFELPKRQNEDLADIDEISGNFEIIDSKMKEIEDEAESKIDKVYPETSGNLPSLNSGGGLNDSGFNIRDVERSSFYKQFLNYEPYSDYVKVTGIKGSCPTIFYIPSYIDGRVVLTLEETFKNQTEIQQVSLPENLMEIYDETFSGCSSLTTIKIPDSVLGIWYRAFSGCRDLFKVDLGNGLISIGQYAFANCTSLTNIKIPNTVTGIGAHAFSGCSSLTTVYIPKSVTSIGVEVFDGCTALTTVLYEGSQAEWQNITMSDSPTWLNLIVYDQEYVKKADLPSGITVDQTYNSASTNAQSGTAVSEAVSAKTDKVASATNGNFAGLDTNGNLTDSGKSPSDIPTTLSALSDDSTHRLVTDTEKSTWNGKSDFSGNYNDLSNKPTIPTVDQSYNSSSANAQSGVAVASAISGKEDSSNKVTSLSAQSTDTQYPSAKCVYDNLSGKQDVIDNNNKLSYSYISGTPTIPTLVSQLTNDSEYLTLGTLPKYDGSVV